MSLKDAPALIERLFPVQKLSAEAYKEQMAGSGKTLTALGSYWKGRKPLILNKACVLGCLLPATDSPERDLEIFEMLMAMDDESFVVRWRRRPRPREILAQLSIARIEDYFEVSPPKVLPPSGPVDWSCPEYEDVEVHWRDDVPELERRRLEVQLLPRVAYRERVNKARRPEEVAATVHDHIWDQVNEHLFTEAHSFQELVEQLGIMRFGHRPHLADSFCGSGQIPFEAARLGCDVYASDLNPIAGLLTWGAFHVVGASADERQALVREQKALVDRVCQQVDGLAVETDGNGWQAKVFLYCVEARCPQTGWTVPMLPSRIISKGYRVIAVLEPDVEHKTYRIRISRGVSDRELEEAENGTIRRESRYDEAYLFHEVDGRGYKTRISTLRGDIEEADGSIRNSLRLWGKQDFKPQETDLLQERLYCIQWMRPKTSGRGDEYEFREVGAEDLARERAVDAFIEEHLVDWQQNGRLPDMRIEVGGPPRYQGQDLVRARGWTHWHHVFNPRQLMLLGLINTRESPLNSLLMTKYANYLAKLCAWETTPARIDADGRQVGGASNNSKQVFTNQALNTLYNYGCRSSRDLEWDLEFKSFPISNVSVQVNCHPASEINGRFDICLTDPPYGDAVKYEEILDIFIAWLRKNPPAEFANWVWDSRRALAIKGEDEDFRRGMVAAYRRLAECMPDNGIQVVMFTHQSGAIWADMANIVWAAGMHVTAAWYVVTETDSALREGSYVKGTVLLVLRRSRGWNKTTRDDLAWEIQEEVEKQVADLTGLNQQAKGLYRDENVFEDADIQMAGYAAALRVLTRYAVIDGRDMTSEAIRPRVKGETTFVDGLIAFAVDTANRCLVPQGVSKGQWEKLSSAERFYLKMLDMEARGAKTLDNYQNFAKALKVRDFKPLLASHKANDARLKSAAEFGRGEMGEGSEFHQSALRAVLYALMELQKDEDGADVLAHLTLNVPNYYSDVTQRALVVELADYLEKRLEALRPSEASAARVLRELVKNQRLG
jgi:putative DNA methylase